MATPHKCPRCNSSGAMNPKLADVPLGPGWHTVENGGTRTLMEDLRDLTGLEQWLLAEVQERYDRSIRLGKCVPLADETFNMDRWINALRRAIAELGE